MENLFVDIVLSTYNGEKFLPQLLSSICGQSFKNWRLWIRDDGSKDNTIGIIEEFKTQDNRIFWTPSHSDKRNLGAAQSFQMLLNALPADSDIFFLCDQDDIWKSEKLFEMLKLYRQSGSDLSNRPTLIFSDMELVDSQGQVLTPSQMSYMRFFPESAILPARLSAQNIVAGCSALGNRALLNLALPIPPQALMHDWWLALVASFAGKVLYCPKILVSYRQHSLNASGGSQLKGIKIGIQLFKSGQFEKLMNERFEQLRLLDLHFSKVGLVFQELRDILRIRESSKLLRITRAIRLKFLPQGFKRQLLFIILLFIWNPRQHIHSNNI